jgi:hypothetical protein
MLPNINLLNILLTPSLPDAIVAMRDDQIITHEAWLKRVHAWQVTLHKARGKRFALFIEDSAEFAAALFGAWQAGKTIYLPADTLDATCQMLQETVDGFLGEFKALYQPISSVACEKSPCSFTELLPDVVGLVVYTSVLRGYPKLFLKKCLN